MNLRTRLIKLGNVNQALREDIIPILEHISFEKTRKNASLEDKIRGKSFLTVNKTVIREVDYISKKVGLEPYYGYVEIKSNKPILTVLCETSDRQKGHMTNEIAEFAAKELTRYLKILGYPSVKCEANYLKRTETTYFTITM